MSTLGGPNPSPAASGEPFREKSFKYNSIPGYHPIELIFKSLSFNLHLYVSYLPTRIEDSVHLYPIATSILTARDIGNGFREWRELRSPHPNRLKLEVLWAHIVPDPLLCLGPSLGCCAKQGGAAASLEQATHRVPRAYRTNRCTQPHLRVQEKLLMGKGCSTWGHSLYPKKSFLRSEFKTTKLIVKGRGRKCVQCGHDGERGKKIQWLSLRSIFRGSRGETGVSIEVKGYIHPRSPRQGTLLPTIGLSLCRRWPPPGRCSNKL